MYIRLLFTQYNLTHYFKMVKLYTNIVILPVENIPFEINFFKWFCY